ncbi:carbohydrate sulfotransferase 15-like [Haliotis asinina]|uniref:carbohydrate sulfotransferase 15-like n=1 Tax=Haliotis asinina TaxID=109174 RepID=UPI003531D0F0
MKIGTTRLVFLLLVSCATIWFMTWHYRGTVIYDAKRPMYSHGYVQYSTVHKSVKQDIRCVGAGPDEAEDLFCMEKPQYLPNFKNPCWYAKEDGKFRLKCLPYYHLLGVCKSGTTDLSYRILAHEDVLGCNDCWKKKEIFYWCRRRYGYTVDMEGVRTPCNFSCFLQKFTTAAQKIEQEVTESGYHNMITGDASPSDFSDFRGWPKIPQNAGLQEPVVTTPHLIRHVYTDPKFILILRNPTDRLYSDYTMRHGQTPEDFHEAVRDDIRIEDACMRNHSVEQCLYSVELARKLRTRIFLGCYSVYMRQWLNVFPRDQFLILRTEDHDKDPTAQLKSVYNYLKLNYTEEWLASITRVPHQNASEKKKRMGPMLEKTRVLLDAFYSRYNHDLADMLQDKMFLWLS